MSLTSVETRNLIRKNLVMLCNEIVLNVDLWNELEEREVVTDTQKAEIICNDRNIPKEQIRKLLQLLPKRGQEKFIEFCFALDATGQRKIVTDDLKLDLQQLQMMKDGKGSGQTAAGSCCASADVGTGSLIPPADCRPQIVSRSSSGSGDASENMSRDDLNTSEASFENYVGSAQVKRSADPEFEHNTALKRLKLAPPDEIEGDDLDLTDALAFREFSVKSSTEEHYKAHSNPAENYPMYKVTRGLAVIINVQCVGARQRRGTDIDAKVLAHLFRSLHFEVIQYDDDDGLSAKDIYQKVALFSQNTRHRDANCAVMILLSHGEENVIYGTDEKTVLLRKLYTTLDCPALRGKPKVVLVQACRGNDIDNGHEDTPSTPAVEQDEHDSKIPSWSDFFIGHSVQPGHHEGNCPSRHQSHRNVTQGSWYVQAIAEVFRRSAAMLSLTDLMTKVNDLVARKESKSSLDLEKHRKVQIPDPHFTLRKKLHFFPGIQRSQP